jgi:hypothetical protein
VHIAPTNQSDSNQIWESPFSRGFPFGELVRSTGHLRSPKTLSQNQEVIKMKKGMGQGIGEGMMKEGMSEDMQSEGKESIVVSVGSFPNIQDIAKGDDVTIMGTVISNDGESVEIEPSDVQSEAGAFKAKDKELSRQPAMEGGSEESEY